jgi:hypothetical protein
MTDDAERDLRRRAEQRADAKIGFQIHALVYVLVNGGLFAINMLTSPHQLWFYWPAFGWGIGLLAHGAGVYARLDQGRERMIAAEMERLRSRS